MLRHFLASASQLQAVDVESERERDLVFFFCFIWFHYEDSVTWNDLYTHSLTFFAPKLEKFDFSYFGMHTLHKNKEKKNINCFSFVIKSRWELKCWFHRTKFEIFCLHLIEFVYSFTFSIQLMSLMCSQKELKLKLFDYFFHFLSNIFIIMLLGI